MPGFGGIVGFSAVGFGFLRWHKLVGSIFGVHSFFKCVVASYEPVLGFENVSLLTTFGPLRPHGVSLASNGAEVIT